MASLLHLLCGCALKLCGDGVECYTKISKHLAPRCTIQQA